MIKSKKILMTGGAGFIGTKLCAQLYENNEVVLYDSLRRNSIESTSLLDNKAVTLISGDVLDLDRLKKVIADFKPEIVIHLAAIAGVDTIIKSPTHTLSVNLVGTFNVLDAIRSSIDRISRFIDFSTSEVFGANAFRVAETDHTRLAPVGEARWTYAISKLAGEHLVHSYHKEFGLPGVTIRPFNVYGPGQVGEGAVHVFVTRALKDQDLHIHGDGDQIRSWCYIDDVVQGVMLTLENEAAIGQVLNIGNPRGTETINSLAEKIVALAGSKSRIIHGPSSPVDVELRIPNIDKAKELLGFKPKIALNDGLKKTIAWYREANNND